MPAGSEEERLKLATKVKRLLALGQSPEPEEAEAAIAKAHELLLKHGLTMAEVDRVEDGRRILDPSRTDMDKIKEWQNLLAGAIARSLGGEAVVRYLARDSANTLDGVADIAFYGPGETAEGMRSMYYFLMEQVQVLAEIEAAKPVDYTAELVGRMERMILGDMTARNPPTPEMRRRDIEVGIVTRVAGRLRERADRIAASESYSSTAIVLSSRSILDDLKAANESLTEGEKLSADGRDMASVRRGYGLGGEIVLDPQLKDNA